MLRGRPGRMPLQKMSPGIVQAVLHPLGGVGFDIQANGIETIFVADDVFIIIAVPDGRGGCVALAVDVFRDGGFEGTYHRA